MSAVSYTERATCRLCGTEFAPGLPHPQAAALLDFGCTPLANAFLREPGPAETYPLYIVACPSCDHVQLPVVVDPEKLFGDYVYVSGTSPVFVEHFRTLFGSQVPFVRRGDLVVDIGSNDGTLLKMFKGVGARVIGVDPARDIAARATSEGVPTLPMFFNAVVAQSVLRGHGCARLITANNVFAHADDLAAIATAVHELLAFDGRFVFEVQYLGDLIDRGHWDNIYHEHTSYHHIAPLSRFLSAHGLTLTRVERVETHGGSIRCTAVKSIAFGVRPLHAQPLRLPEMSDELRARDARLTGTALRDELRAIADDIGEKRIAFESAFRPGETVVGYGAPAKATTLLYALGIAARFAYIVDDSAFKQGRFMPEGRIPVGPSTAIFGDGVFAPHVVVVLAWNFADAIVKRLAPFLEGGAGRRVIVPAPHFKTIESPLTENED